MATGYTYKIEDGTITDGKEFIRYCAENMHSIGNKEDRLVYYRKQIAVMRRQIRQLKALKPASLSRRVGEFYKDNIKYYDRTIDEQLTILNRYDRILKTVVNWRCYSRFAHEEFRELKQFAIDQITKSIEATEHYCNALRKSLRECVEAQMGDEEWREWKIGLITKAIAGYEEDYSKLKSRLEFCTKFHLSLEKSLDQVN